MTIIEGYAVGCNLARGNDLLLRGEYNSKLLLLEFEVANVVAKGRVREKDKENVVKEHEVKSGQRRI